jgi:methyl-accepting chemotaxis protein
VKNLSIKTKTFILSGIVMCILLVVGGVGIYAVDYLSKSVTTVSKQSLPAVRNMTLVDMMHDGVRAVVYRSIVAGPEEKAEIETEYKEFSANISRYLKEIETLGLNKELNDEIQATHPVIAKFQEDGHKVLEASFTGDKEKARAILPEFIKSFDKLAVVLEAIGEKIQAQAATQSNDAEKAAHDLTRLSLIIVAFGILVSCFVSYMAYRFINGLTTDLLHITQGLKDEAFQIVDTSQEMASVAGKLSEASTEQAASLQETVASIDEISAMITRNADSATTSAKMSEQSTLIAQKGKEKSELMMESIEAIASGNDEIISQMQKSNTEISEIIKVIQDIGQKTQVINDIVFQTKLLSFNASVEAARAGEHGKGFAVVAEEVGNLASMSGKAATEITDMLSKSVNRVTEIVNGTKGLMDNLIRQSKEKVEFGTSTARECSKALEEILSNVSSVNEMVREISTASQEQSTGVREVNKAMSELDQVTQSNSGIAQESSKAATGLNQQADRLNSLVAELTRMVGGKETEATPAYAKNSHQPQRPMRTQQKTNNVVALKKPAAKAYSAPQMKKVVGLEFDAPSSNDPRFEDV